MIRVRLRTRFRNDATGCLSEPARTRQDSSVTVWTAGGRFVVRCYGEAERCGVRAVGAAGRVGLGAVEKKLPTDRAATLEHTFEAWDDGRMPPISQLLIRLGEASGSISALPMRSLRDEQLIG